MLSSGRRLARVSAAFLFLALMCIPFADIEIYSVEPWTELTRMGQGLLHPNMNIGSVLWLALAQTVAFALLAVAGSAAIGLCLAMVFQSRLVRAVCATSRAVHELFWGLIFMQFFGLSATTGLLAILVPFCGVFAKVYAEILERQSRQPIATVAVNSDRLSRYAYTLLPLAWPALVNYTRYRFECALRSSTILGFIGLPTLGFYLDTAFKQGQYADAATLLLLFFGLIASLRFWFRPRYLVLYLLAAVYFLPSSPAVTGTSGWQFFSVDIWPQSVREGNWLQAWGWYQHQLVEVALPALVDTVLLSQLALVLSGLLALTCYGWASPQVLRGGWHRVGQALLLVLRSTPEMVFAFIVLLLVGPSGLPAIIALALHNGGLVAFLLASHSETLSLRTDAAKGVNRFLYELTPRLYPQMMALLLYRWEVILRESAILGFLGITTLGFYIDSAFEDIRYDRAFLLIAVAALLNLLVDSLARRVRRYCQLQSMSVS